MARATDGTILNVDVGTCRGGGTTDFTKTGDERDSCDVELKPRDVKTSVGKTEYEFKRWKIGKAIQTSGEESINVDLTSDKTVLAVFEKIGARALEVKAQLADGTPISPGVSVTTCWGTDTTDFIQRGDPIETCSVDLKESDKVSGIYDFERWIIGGSQRGVGADSVSFGLLNNDKTAVALYAPRTVDLTVRARNEAGNLLSRGVQVKTCFNSTEYKRTDFTVSGNATNSCKVNLKDGEKSFDNGNYLFKNWKMGGFSYPDGDDPIFPSLFSDRIVTAIYTGEDPPAPLSVTLTPIDEDRDGRFEVGEKIFLEADVSGTAKGTINYTFYCNKPAAWTDVREGWIHKKDGTNDDPYKTPSGESCVFNSVGDKSPKVIVERGTAPNAEDREPITIVESNNPPELEVNIWVQGHKTQDTVKLNKGASSTVEWAVEKGITQECEIRKIILDGDSTHVSSEQSGTDTINSISSFISYTMYCSANDGELEDSDTVNINVKIEPPCSVTIDAENKGNGCWDVNGIVSGATRCSGGAVPTVEGVENWLAESFTEGSNTVENICPEQTTNLTLGCNECTGAPLTLIPLNDTKYVCNTSTYSCSAVDGGTSSDYSTMEACDANCNPSPCIGDDCTGTPKYKCTSNGSCSTSGGSGKAYTSQLRCDVNCDTTPQSGYICNTERKACEWSASGGSGFLSCLESCGVPKKPEVCDPSFQVCDYSKLLRSFIEEINPGETSFNIFNFFRDMLPGFIVKTYAR
ncbi:hypothetical protein KKH05_00040 [Patescibacteria group bacterium]|nr:hypothetical protein [Patescibacteria group bacterium]